VEGVDRRQLVSGRQRDDQAATSARSGRRDDEAAIRRARECGDGPGRARRGAEDEALAVVLDLGLGQRVQIGGGFRSALAVSGFRLRAAAPSV